MSRRNQKKQTLPLKPRIAFAVRRLELQVQRLDQATDRFKQRDKAIFARIVDAYTKHDAPRARVFANELTEIRKVLHIIYTANFAIGQVIKRINAIETINDAVPALATAAIALRSVRIQLISIFPEAESELGEIGNALSGMMVEAGQRSAAVLDFSTVTLEAQLLFHAAEQAAEQALKELPEIKGMGGKTDG